MAQARGQPTLVPLVRGRTEGSAHMSEAPPGGRDSRPEKDPRLSGEPPAPHGDAYSWYQRGLEVLGRGSAAAAAQRPERAAEAEPGSPGGIAAVARGQVGPLRC